MAATIAVLANCQHTAFARCLRVLLPQATVRSFFVADAAPRAAEVLGHLRGCDCVFVQPLEDAAFGPLRTSALAESVRRLETFPKVAFTGFHPDMTYLFKPGGPIKGPMGDYHSVIAVAGFLAGLSVDATVDLFNAFTYSSLGYFEFDSARMAFVDACGRLGYEVADDFDGWAGRGVFMHSFNHPKVCVTADLAVMAARKAGFDVPGDLPLDEIVPDDLAFGMKWPVYPEIAQRLGLRGSLLFRTSVAENFATMTLGDFVSDSFTIYRDAPRQFLEIPRVQRALEIVG